MLMNCKLGLFLKKAATSEADLHMFVVLVRQGINESFRYWKSFAKKSPVKVTFNLSGQYIERVLRVLFKGKPSSSKQGRII
jgi:hypothetical protein